ncbi:glycosyltransferase family 4 protein [Patescibacteria group bacterium]
MKIGIDCRIYSSKFTGIGRYVYELTERLSKFDDGHDYVLFFNKPEFDKYHAPSPKFKKILADAPIYSLREQTHFNKILRAEKLDLMHFTHFNAPVFYKGKSIVTIHDLTLSFFPGKKKRSILHRFGYHFTLRAAVKKAKKVITISQNSKKDLIELIGTPEDKIEVIYQGVSEKFKIIEDSLRIKKTLERYGLARSPFLLYTGVWRSHKNIPNMLRAFKKVRELCEEDLKMVITGKEDPYYPEVRELPKEIGIEDHVIFTGLVDENELVDLYNAASLYVFPSFYEGFGLPPLEAMACGTPVAASETSSIPEICGKGNAVFFDPNDHGDMAQVIYALYRDKAMQEDLVRRGLLRVGEFSWQTMAELTYNLYKECLNN